MISYNENEKRKIIMDYYSQKRNRVDSFDNNNYQKIYLHSSSCVDEITIYFNNEKTDFKMVSKGCAIFLSSSEIFVERIIKLGFENKNKIIDSYKNLIERKEISDEEKEMLEKLNVFENVDKHLNRKECALIIAKVFEIMN